ncbi:prepilin-type N-terminal cleavage/methylation domain-containing protein [Oryzomonas japonica]|uniref:Prepilin-type N-terminal cleavage/methylation domain-containing protein n=1 Tax=Oryzomonas japonica TaxID=2603858 RepID=A0A7J4ZPU2_9BACT|nr:prepilin-type N-terminal cleavage/methylation domain-containing protein [Oryzomonas japonica]KAB0664890.1 prepilin-type N-terminal cleavage/methylation domain-containing protein [Oryzomonas japonica]
MRVNNKGFTLIEVLIATAVFVIVLMITGSAFKTILEQSTKVFRSEESNIEGVIGLEMLRHDLQQAGLGLFTETSSITYTGEALNAPASTYNDFNTGTEPPRPIIAGNNVASASLDPDSSGNYKILANTDYLVIKASTVSTSKTAQKWTYLEISPPNVTPHSWASAAENLGNNDNVVLLKRQVSATGQSTTLMANTSGSPTNFSYAFSNTAFAQFSSSSNAIYTAYGIDSSTPRMPFNRADYFVAQPTSSAGSPDASRIPGVCAKDASGNPSPYVGILYKAMVNHSDGKLTYFPLLDCVVDMQVVLGWDMDGDGAIDCYSNADGTVMTGVCTAPTGGTVVTALSLANNASAATVPNIRNNLKLVKIYVLAQNGRRDLNYTSPSPIVVGDSNAAEISLTSSYDLAAKGLLNYRWKLYRLVVRPKNLFSNE